MKGKRERSKKQNRAKNKEAEGNDGYETAVKIIKAVEREEGTDTEEKFKGMRKLTREEGGTR